MLGSLKGFVALAKQRNNGIVCFLQRKTLTSKSVVAEVQKVLAKTVEMDKYIKSMPLESSLFSAL
jgi:hypothetical protein